MCIRDRLVAAKEQGIDYIGIEIEPSYIDIIEKRLNKINYSKKEVIEENLPLLNNDLIDQQQTLPFF